MSLLLDVFAGQPTNRPPVWFMRQAGRVLKSYRELREKHSFKTLLKTPKLAVEVTLQPVRELGVDGAIVFSDILVIPEALGMSLEFTEKGPRFLKSLSQGMTLKDCSQELNYIYEVIREVKKKLPPNIPLIGFCGGPLTVFCYMVEGMGGRGDFLQAIKWLYHKPQASKEVLAAITEMSIHYVKKQVEAGIEVFQLFETWAGLVPYPWYREAILPQAHRILAAVKEAGKQSGREKNIPTLFFPRGIGTGLYQLPADIADGVSIDWQTPLAEAFLKLPANWVLQGNIDPRLLLPGKVWPEHLEYYLQVGRRHPNWIINCGHGLLPSTPQQEVKALVDWIKGADWGR